MSWRMVLPKARLCTAASAMISGLRSPSGVKDSVLVVSGSYKAINRELEDGTKVRIEEPKKDLRKKPRRRTVT